MVIFLAVAAQRKVVNCAIARISWEEREKSKRKQEKWMDEIKEEEQSPFISAIRIGRVNRPPVHLKNGPPSRTQK